MEIDKNLRSIDDARLLNNAFTLWQRAGYEGTAGGALLACGVEMDSDLFLTGVEWMVELKRKLEAAREI